LRFTSIVFYTIAKSNYVFLRTALEDEVNLNFLSLTGEGGGLPKGEYILDSLTLQETEN